MGTKEFVLINQDFWHILTDELRSNPKRTQNDYIKNGDGGI